MQDLLAQALRKGATSGDVSVSVTSNSSVTCRKGELEKSILTETTNVSMRVLVGQRVAMVSTNETDPAIIDRLADRAVATAKLSPDDPFAGLVPEEGLAQDLDANYDLLDVAEFSAEAKLNAALEMEDAALAVTGVREVGSASASAGSVYQGICTSNGFVGEHRMTNCSLSCIAIAADENGMERDYDWRQACHLEDLLDPKTVGASAGELARDRLGGQVLPSGQMPVILAPRIGNSIVGSLLSAINGGKVAKGLSFLKDAMGQQLFADSIQIVDDPHMLRKIGSRSFDGEGVATRKTKIVDDGHLASWLLNNATANQLGLERTGHGMPHGSGPGGGYNLYLAPGSVSPNELMRDIKNGLFVTALFGGGMDELTGDYSNGASGFAIRDGQIAGPVKGVTIAGNLTEMFRNMIPADDLEYRYGIDVPTLRIDGMTIAGS